MPLTVETSSSRARRLAPTGTRTARSAIDCTWVTRTFDSAAVALVAALAVAFASVAVRRASALVVEALLRAAFCLRVAAAFWPRVVAAFCSLGVAVLGSLVAAPFGSLGVAGWPLLGVSEVVAIACLTRSWSRKGC